MAKIIDFKKAKQSRKKLKEHESFICEKSLAVYNKLQERINKRNNKDLQLSYMRMFTNNINKIN